MKIRGFNSIEDFENACIKFVNSKIQRYDDFGAKRYSSAEIPNVGFYTYRNGGICIYFINRYDNPIIWQSKIREYPDIQKPSLLLKKITDIILEFMEKTK